MKMVAIASTSVQPRVKTSVPPEPRKSTRTSVCDVEVPPSGCLRCELVVRSGFPVAQRGYPARRLLQALRQIFGERPRDGRDRIVEPKAASRCGGHFRLRDLQPCKDKAQRLGSA